MPRSLPGNAELSPSSRCDPGQAGVRRPEFIIVANRSSQLYFDTSRYFVSADGSMAAALRSTRSRSSAASLGTITSLPGCRSHVDVDEIAVNWKLVRIIFVVLDVLLLVHRLTRLHVELDRMRLSGTAGSLMWSPSDGGSAAGITVLPVDGVVSPVRSMSSPPPHVGNHVGTAACGSVDEYDDDEGLDFMESRATTTNSLCVMTERGGTGSNNVSSTLTRPCSIATGSGTLHRRVTPHRSSPDIVPRLVCLVALLAALFHARATTTTGRGVMWLRGALPSAALSSTSLNSTSAIGRHFHDDVGTDSLSDDFRQLQAFVDFFNRGKLVVIICCSLGNGRLKTFLSNFVSLCCLQLLLNFNQVLQGHVGKK